MVTNGVKYSDQVSASGPTFGVNYREQSQLTMTEQSPYAVTIEDLEDAVHVPAASLVEGQSDPAVPHDLPSEDMALGRSPGMYS